MWLGTVYVCLTSFDLFTYHFFHPGVSDVFEDFYIGAFLVVANTVYSKVVFQ